MFSFSVSVIVSLPVHPLHPTLGPVAEDEVAEVDDGDADGERAQGDPRRVGRGVVLRLPKVV